MTSHQEHFSLSYDAAVAQLDAQTYEAQLNGAWVTGKIPHGGFIATVFLNTACGHFGSTLKDRDQPDTMSMHIEYLRSCQVGRAILKVKHIKLGRQTSTIHISLEQESKEKAVAYVIQTNFKNMKGVSLPTLHSLSPPPHPSTISALRENRDSNWQLHQRFPYTQFNKAITRIKCYLPVHGQPHKSIVDEWIQLANGESFTNTSLGYVSDIWPSIGEAYRFPRDPYDPNNPAPEDGSNDDSAFWYPTLNSSIEVKKRLPERGVDFLFVRVRATEIRDGRMDLDIRIYDPEGELVALTKQIVMVIDAQRNWKGGKNAVDNKL